jgi:arylsulfatase A-like enzyme
MVTELLRVKIVPRSSIAILAIAFSSCSAPEPAGPIRAADVKCSDCNLILISIDTLRADHLGCYGYDREISPNIDHFRQDSVLFETAIAQAPSTAPSHASILTGTNPSRHGVSVTHRTPLPSDMPTAAEILAAEGFRTAAFVGGGQVAPEFGFDRGFEVFDADGTGFSDKVQAATEWIGEVTANRFMLLLHTYEVHHPYTPDQSLLIDLDRHYDGPLPDAISIPLLKSINRGETKIDRSDVQHTINAYDAEIRSMDRAFGKLIDHLKEVDLYDRSILVFMSDHGEEFMEHGALGWHGHSLFDELLRVPLIVKFPRSAARGSSIPHLVRTVDLLPTLLETLSIPALKDIDGVSLLQPSPPLLAFSRTDTQNRNDSIRSDRWKLYGSRLYDLGSDPQELRDVAPQNRKVVRQLQRELALVIENVNGSSSPSVDFSNKTLEDLRALGYLD